MSVKAGDTAPEFVLPKADGTPFSLSEQLKKGAVVLYFYPKDDTPGCTAEACSFRDAYDVFKEAGAEVVGISSDSEASHATFQKKHGLQFTLVSDPGGNVRRLYGVPKTLGFMDGRVTYVIDAKGVVRHVFNSQLRATKHVEEALAILKAPATA